MGEKKYCGPDFMPNWAREKVSNLFNEDCKVHDEDYTGGKNRILADVKFLYSMIKRCHAEKYPWYSYFVAFFFFFMVLIFGFLTFEKAKKK